MTIRGGSSKPVARVRGAMAAVAALSVALTLSCGARAEDKLRLAQATAPAAAAPAVTPTAPKPAPVAPSPYGVQPSAPPAPVGAPPPPSAALAPATAQLPPATAPATPPAEPPAGAAPASAAAPALPAPPAPAAEAAPRPAALLPHDLSPWGMFMAADIVVKVVMSGLALASVITWTIWLVKVLELTTANRQVRRALHTLRESSNLLGSARALPPRGGASARLIQSALGELEASRALPAEGIKERVAISLNRIEAAAGRRMSLGTGLLATIGSTAPFIGLFGTVWGIMNSFIGISKAQTTNLAVVAPGIAEALLATAIGLVAAIPAVIIYNVFARAISNYKASLSDASAEVMRHLSRDLDREASGANRLRAAAE
ncbi:tonB-system energizer ExbB [Azorhizobium sp. AG788]|uniref:tonB-system energizer ExbB n=1 Tax=Azorhizobium sp. AG788 TaxID=2183897 RepID=UPI00105F44F5|nr:tonB-system energizer ExbB [Azorhizobium sp. AG788]